jgi:hypothetical protein
MGADAAPLDGIQCTGPDLAQADIDRLIGK